MSKEAFESWYMSLHGSDVDDLAVWGGESPFHDEHEYKHRNTWMKYQAWQAATDAQQTRIDELEQKVKDWERSYKEITSAWSHDKIKRNARIEELESKLKESESAEIMEHYIHSLDIKGHADTLSKNLEQAQADRKHYGVHLAAALKGEKLPSEPVDQRLDAVREMRDELIFMLEQSYEYEYMQDRNKIQELRNKYKVKP